MEIEPGFTHVNVLDGYIFGHSVFCELLSMGEGKGYGLDPDRLNFSKSLTVPLCVVSRGIRMNEVDLRDQLFLR